MKIVEQSQVRSTWLCSFIEVLKMILYVVCVNTESPPPFNGLLAVAVAPSGFAQGCPRILTCNMEIFEGKKVSFHHGIEGIWATPVLFVPPLALLSSKKEAHDLLDLYHERLNAASS